MNRFVDARCIECSADLEHCHGTAIVFADGAAECTDDPDCHLPAIAHRFAVSYDEAFEDAAAVTW